VSDFGIPASITTTITLTVTADIEQRWKEQQRRWAMLEGEHSENIRDAINATLAPEIAALIELTPDMSANPFKQVWQELNVLYMGAPDVTVEGQEDADLSLVVTERLWPQMQKGGLYTLGINEALVRLDWPTPDEIAAGAAAEVQYRIVPPHKIGRIEAAKGQPDVPAALEEARLRVIDGTPLWTWDVWDVRDPANPVFRIEVDKADGASGRDDITEQVAPELAEKYPYMDKGGAPIFPWILRHATVGNDLFSTNAGIELVSGSLTLAAMWTDWRQGFSNSATPKMVGIDVEAPAGVVKEIAGVGVRYIPTHRDSLTLLKSTQGTGGTVATLQPGMDPAVGVAALRSYEERLAIGAGLSPSDLQITQGQSGYAIVVSRAGKVEARRRYTPAATFADRLMLATGARMSNSFGGTNLPEDAKSYSISYPTLAADLDEQKKRVDLAALKRDQGFADPIEAIREARPEIESDEEAAEILIRIQRVKDDIAQRAQTPEPGNEP